MALLRCADSLDAWRPRVVLWNALPVQLRTLDTHHRRCCHGHGRVAGAPGIAAAGSTRPLPSGPSPRCAPSLPVVAGHLRPPPLPLPWTMTADAAAASEEASSPYFSSLPPSAFPKKPTAPNALARWLTRMARRVRALANPPDASNFKAAVHRTEAEWRRLLSPVAYAVMRRKQTEAPFSGEYDALYPDDGFFKCAACSQPLYSAKAKFNSGCGWPAYVPIYVLEFWVLVKREAVRVGCAEGGEGHVTPLDGAWACCMEFSLWCTVVSCPSATVVA